MKSIKWIDAATSKPAIDDTDHFNSRNGHSKKVLVWVKNESLSKEEFSAFAVYIHHEQFPAWSISGYMGNYTVTHYAEINAPIV